MGGLTVFDLCTTEHPGRENINTDVGEDFKVAYFINSLYVLNVRRVYGHSMEQGPHFTNTPFVASDLPV